MLQAGLRAEVDGGEEGAIPAFRELEAVTRDERHLGAFGYREVLLQLIVLN